MSKKKKIVLGVIVAVAVLAVFFGGYKYGQYRCKPCPKPEVRKEVAVKKPAVAKKKPSKKVAQAPSLVSAPAPAPVLALIPALVPASQKLTLRLNVVEWSQIFEGKSLMSRDIGPLIRKGLSEGTVKRTIVPLTFNINGAMVTVRNGQAVLDPGQIGPGTAIVVQPPVSLKFASPPDELPLVTGPEELDFLVKKGVRELWLNFILAPR